MPTTTARHSFLPLRDDVQAALLASYPDLIARLAWSRARIVAHQRIRLRELVTHATAHSPFHARRLAGVDVDGLDPEDMSALPVMTKTQMMNEFDDVVTDRRLGLRRVEEALTGAG